MTDPTAYRARVRALGTSTSTGLAALLAAYLAGHLTAADFTAAAAALVARSNSTAAGLADAGLAQALTALGTLALPLGITPPADDFGRLVKSFTTIVGPGAGEDPALLARLSMRVDRVANSEPLITAQATWQTGLRVREVPGWTRSASPGACALCASLADGTVLSPDTPMVTHPGCTCVAEPALREVTTHATGRTDTDGPAADGPDA